MPDPDDGMPVEAYGRVLALFQRGRDHDAIIALYAHHPWLTIIRAA